VAPESADALDRELAARGVPGARIGRLTDRSAGVLEVVA
jgi:hypothetical protein